MTLGELLANLKTHNVPESWYGINVGLKTDACIIQDWNGQWEGLYVDERGGQSDYSLFLNAEHAYDWLWKKMLVNLEVFGNSR